MPNVRALTTLLRWLGPWASSAKFPPAVHRQELVLGDGHLRVLSYRKPTGTPTGIYLVVHGMHFEGPEEPRTDRLCRVLADAGFLVVSPFLADYMKLKFSDKAIEDLAQAWCYVSDLAFSANLPKPAIFSISLGSILSLKLATRQKYRDTVGALVIFGGCLDLYKVMNFALTGIVESAGSRMTQKFCCDPLNVPVVFINILPYLKVADDCGPLAEAWLEVVRRTWGDVDLNSPEERKKIVQDIASTLPAEQRDLFWIGCGLRPGGVEIFNRFLREDHPSVSIPVENVRAPVFVIHGYADNVVPWPEAEKICLSLSPGHPHRLFLTRLYGHSREAALSLMNYMYELRTLVGFLWCLVGAPIGSGKKNRKDGLLV